MWQTLLGGAIAFLGIVTGAILQQRFAKANAISALFNEAQQKAYVDYLGAVALLATTGKGHSALADANSALADAKSRVVIYGTDEVLQRMAELECVGAHLGQPESREVFLRLIHAMRDSRAKSKIGTEQLTLILFGNPAA
jgi:hypothetical protein